MDNAEHLYIAMIAIMKAGAAYLYSVGDNMHFPFCRIKKSTGGEISARGSSSVEPSCMDNGTGYWFV